MTKETIKIRPNLKNRLVLSRQLVNKATVSFCDWLLCLKTVAAFPVHVVPTIRIGGIHLRQELARVSQTAHG